MTNLSQRVEKAKKAEYTNIPGCKGAYATWGSSGTYENRYQVFLAHTTQKINHPYHPTEKLQISIINAICNQGSGVGRVHNCPGNERHTVCYHSLGAIYNAFLNKSQKFIYYYETYQDALCGLRLHKDAKLLKVKSSQGNGEIWAVTRPAKKTKSLNSLAVNLMRGNESDEGID